MSQSTSPAPCSSNSAPTTKYILSAYRPPVHSPVETPEKTPVSSKDISSSTESKPIRNLTEEIQKLKKELMKQKANLTATRRQKKEIKKKIEQNQSDHVVRKAQKLEHKQNIEAQWSMHKERIEEFIHTLKDKHHLAKIHLNVRKTGRNYEEEMKWRTELTENSKKEVEKLKKEKENGEKSGPKNWLVCEYCFEPYSYEVDHFPRFLACGHTLCYGCIKKLTKPDHIRCPQDGFVTAYVKDCNELRKNFWVFNMLEEVQKD
uniref:RING-type domain-containing protein n=1 Tax=Caenorhabditis tropicalis TaxID=1561998 RepID=A0A1I7T9X0_9PELO